MGSGAGGKRALAAYRCNGNPERFAAKARPFESLSPRSTRMHVVSGGGAIFFSREGETVRAARARQKSNNRLPTDLSTYLGNVRRTAPFGGGTASAFLAARETIQYVYHVFTQRQPGQKQFAAVYIGKRNNAVETAQPQRRKTTIQWSSTQEKLDMLETPSQHETPRNTPRDPPEHATRPPRKKCDVAFHNICTSRRTRRDL